MGRGGRDDEVVGTQSLCPGSCLHRFLFHLVLALNHLTLVLLIIIHRLIFLFVFIDNVGKIHLNPRSLQHHSRSLQTRLTAMSRQLYQRLRHLQLICLPPLHNLLLDAISLSPQRLLHLIIILLCLLLLAPHDILHLGLAHIPRLVQYFLIELVYLLFDLTILLFARALLDLGWVIANAKQVRVGHQVGHLLLEIEVLVAVHRLVVLDSEGIELH